jgi:hypothetical protein
MKDAQRLMMTMYLHIKFQLRTKSAMKNARTMLRIVPVTSQMVHAHHLHSTTPLDLIHGGPNVPRPVANVIQ